MRTIQVMNCKWYNATAWYATYLTKILNQNNHESLLITLPHSIVSEQVKKLGVNYIELPLRARTFSDFYTCYKGIKRICKEFKPDIVNCHRSENFLLWAYLKRQFNYKLVRTRGDQRLPKNTYLNKYIYQKFSDAFIVTNSRLKQYYQNEMDIPQSKIFTILGGVDTQVFYPKNENRILLRQELGFSDNDIVLGVIGRLDRVKGQFETVEAFKRALSMDTNQDKILHLVFVGRESNFYMQELKDFAIKLELPEKQIHFFDYFNDINQFMNLLDVGVISSIGSEAIARVAFEMIACGIPIIGSTVGVMPDILEKDFMFSPANIDEMARLFLQVKDEDFRNRICQSTNSRFRGTGDTHSIYGWTMDDFYQKTMAVYNTLV